MLGLGFMVHLRRFLISETLHEGFRYRKPRRVIRTDEFSFSPGSPADPQGTTPAPPTARRAVPAPLPHLPAAAKRQPVEAHHPTGTPAPSPAPALSGRRPGGSPAP